jgi:DNA mismatch repair protein MutS2
MIYPLNFEQKTGFDQIRQMLHEACISSLGRFYLEKMKFITQFELLQNHLDQTEEFRQILITNDNCPTSNYYDPFPVFSRIKLEGTFAETDELTEIRSSLTTIADLIKFLGSRKSEQSFKYPVLNRLTENIFIEPSIIKELDRILDEKGQVRNNASSQLAEIRRSKSQLETQALRRINQLFSQAKKEGWIDSNTELALRNGRQVIPVPVSYKRKIKGFVHDQSTTGQTVFLEPEEVFETNNEIRQLELDERREIIRILKELANFLRPFLPMLKEAYLFLGKIDFIRSKAKIALEMQALKPRLHNIPQINWIRARHPLLFLAFKAQKKHVEPLSINLAAPSSIIVISGPNAGGKSVCLKTVGLVQYMLQCGMLVPMEDHSDAGIFKDLFIDIGDEQSIENDLSTYSSHLANMRFFLKNCNPSSLFLIDEFGAGTEPRLGGAIAEAILEELSKRNAVGVVTTHYANLKILAGKDPGIINGSMLFDTQNMRPLYRLKTGNPGSSFAFEIARSMGLPADILGKASQLAGEEHIDFDRQLQDLELKKLELEEKEKQLRSGDTFLSEMIEKYQKLYNDMEARKNEIIVQAKSEAKKILADSNRIIEKTVKEIREASAEKEKTRQLRENLETFSSQFETVDTQENPSERKKKKLSKQPRPEAPEIEIGPIGTGDFVRIKGQDTIGEVIETGSKDALVAFGSMQLKTAIGKLEKLSRRSVRQAENRIKVKLDFDINEKAAEFNPTLDVRGQRAQDALIKARRFVDDAILLGANNLKIVHGTGDGILREALRDYLRTLREVKRTRDEHPDRGGAGCTLIELDIKKEK